MNICTDYHHHRQFVRECCHLVSPSSLLLHSVTCTEKWPRMGGRDQ